MAFLISDAVLLECKTWVAYALDSGRVAPHEGVRFRARSILGLDIQTATGAYLDALCGIPTRPAGMTDAELRERYLKGPIPWQLVGLVMAMLAKSRKP